MGEIDVVDVIPVVVETVVVSLENYFGCSARVWETLKLYRIVCYLITSAEDQDISVGTVSQSSPPTHQVHLAYVGCQVERSGFKLQATVFEATEKAQENCGSPSPIRYQATTIGQSRTWFVLRLIVAN